MKPSRWVLRQLGRLVVVCLLVWVGLLNRLGDLLMWLFVRPPADVPWRPVSGLERLWVAWNRLHPFIIQHVVEGRFEDGAELDLERLEQALEKVADRQPGLCMRLRGARSWLHWIADGPRPRLRVVSGKDWSGYEPGGAPFLDEPLDPVRGPVAEVLVVQGDPLRFVFRVPHAVTDGAGSMLFVQGFFAALRGESLTAVHAGPPIDAEIGRNFCPPKRPPREPRAPSPIKPSAEPTDEASWARVRIPGNLSMAVARVGVAVAESALVPINKSLVRFSVPVDMRRLARRPPSSANLTGSIKLGLAHALGSEDPVTTLHRDILQALVKREFGWGPVVFHRFLRLISLRRLSRYTRRLAIWGQGSSTSTAALSHVGGFKIADFSGGGFRASSIFSVPPNFPFGELILGLVQTDDALEIVAHHPGSRRMSEQLRQLLDGVAQRLGEQA